MGKNKCKGIGWIMNAPYIEISEHKNLESRVDKLEVTANDTNRMVKEMHDVFVGTLGQTPLITRISMVEVDIQDIKKAHNQDRWLVMGGVSVLAFLFSVFGDTVKKMIGLI